MILGNVDTEYLEHVRIKPYKSSLLIFIKRTIRLLLLDESARMCGSSFNVW